MTDERRRTLHRRVRLIVAFTITWNVVEAVVALASGVAASSAALIGFGLDSVIEVASAVAVAWQFTRRDPERWERVTVRAIALSFFALAAYVTVDAVLGLVGVREPGQSPWGIGIAVASLLVMPALAWVDLRSSFSNPRKPLGSLISRVLRGSRARRPRTRGAQIADERGPVRENSRQSQTRLSVSNRAELIAGYADGVPVRELATRFNVHRGTVREIARQAGLAARRPELPDATRQDAAQLYAGGLTLAQVAARLAVSTEAVRSAVIASGGTIRAGGRRRVGA